MKFKQEHWIWVRPLFGVISIILLTSLEFSEQVQVNCLALLFIITSVKDRIWPQPPRFPYCVIPHGRLQYQAMWTFMLLYPSVLMRSHTGIRVHLFKCLSGAERFCLFIFFFLNRCLSNCTDWDYFIFSEQPLSHSWK